MSSIPTTLVLGGTGKTGRRIVDRLTARRVPVRVGSRSGAPRFDWSDRATWSAVLTDVDAVYLSYAPDLAVPGAIDDIRAFTDLAVSTGVQRLVLLSGRGEDEAQSCEKLVQDAGVDWTIIRASWFNQNFSENYLLEPVLAGEVILPAAEVAEPFVDADDIADVAVAALTEAGHTGQVYEVTGPRLLTFADAVAEIAAATGRPIRFAPTSAADYATALTDHGVPTDAVTLLTYLFTTVLDGRNAHLADGVQRALGRPPRDFTDYCRDVAATGGWTA
ncbi:NAD(P)H-binding protein [Micromonospora sp. NPDC023814]|uniref:NAD(P)H-binding protein n=1 Tax=Micromonospora sp. NPDC023814 TaxID=3154596 RepID=UPI0034014D01